MAALLCSLTGSFNTLLAWRFVHGLAAACVTVTRSVVRDLYSGRQMARVMSLTFVVFLIVPIIAPSLGQLILLGGPVALHFRRVRGIRGDGRAAGDSFVCRRRCTRNIA